MGLSETARVTLQVQFVDAGQYDGREPNTLYITRNIVCGQLLNRSVAVILLHYGRHMPISTSSTAAYALGFYRVPTVGVGIQDAEFSRKTVYPTFLRTSPPYSNEARVFLHLLHELQYREVVVVHVKADVNALQFVAVFEKDRSDFKIHVQKYIELDITSSLNTSVEEYFEDVTSNIIILFAKTEDAEVIIDSAPVLSTPGKVCMLSEQASNARRLPTGCLSVRPRQNPLSALRDAMMVMRNGVEFLADYEVDPPQQCANNALNSDWTNAVGNAFYKHLLSTAVFGDNKIEFNEKGDRINIAYDITNSVDGKLEVVGYMSGQNRMELDESRIVWLGGLSKPLEITLPKHLRAVTVADYPFVYAVPTIDSEGCEKLDTVLVEGIDVINGSIDTGFTFDLHLNDSYGAVLLGENGYVLNGMVGELDIDMADLAVGALTINPEREQYIDFSEPWLYHGIRILEKWKPRYSPMESFLQPLNSSLWSALFISVLLVGCAIFLLDLYSPFDRFFKVDKSRIDPDDPFLEPTEDDRLEFGEAMWFVWGVLLNSGVSEKTPRSCSGRALGIVWCGFCMIMVASYTANLAAFLVLDQPEKGLTGVTDPRLRNPAANFSFGTVLDTNTYQYFKRHVELSTMHRNMEAHNVRAAAHAVRALINETLDAFIWDSTRLEFEAARNCELRTRGTLFGRSAYGIGLQKNSPWTPHITNAILRLTES
uniref:Ionotropic glutamate receptor C-terminal domain-containing protein n=1 Tax=Parascaris univalens TaxID=6257 RepID=A0A915ABN9_PARUN